LDADKYTLDGLASNLQIDDMQVISENGSYFLTSSVLDTLDDVDEVRQRAQQMIKALSGILALETGRAVNLGDASRIVRLHEDGRRSAFVHLSAVSQVTVVGHATASVIGANGEVVSAKPALRWFEKAAVLAQQHPAVAEALGHFGKDGSRVSNLYKVLEIIEDDVGAARKIQQKGWATGNDWERFTYSMNRPNVLGEEARHASKRQSPAHRLKPMLLPEAHSFISGLLRRWIDWKSGGSN
jgi:hypothetical protein